jgi:hypothetical protein
MLRKTFSKASVLADTQTPNSVWYVLKSHRMLASRKASPVLVWVRPPGIRQPIWRDSNTVCEHTIANSGKVEYIRNNDQVNIAPCRMDGALLGKGVAAAAHEIKNEATDHKDKHLLDQKHDLMKKCWP